MSETKTEVTHSFPILGLLGVAFIVLKLCGVIHWSWWWVTVPFWGPVALILALVVAGFLGWSIYWLLREVFSRNP